MESTAQTVMDHIFQYTMEIDRQLLLWIQDHLRFVWLTPIMRFITVLGDAGAIWIALAIFIIIMKLIHKKHRPTGYATAIALAIGFVATNLLLKNWVARPRPFDASFLANIHEAVKNPAVYISQSFGIVPITDLLGKYPTDFSFPSGHATASVATCMTVSMNRLIPRWVRIPTVLLAILIPFSRMYLGVHYPTDILGGIIVGMLAALLADQVMRLFTRRKRRQNADNCETVITRSIYVDRDGREIEKEGVADGTRERGSK